MIDYLLTEDFARDRALEVQRLRDSTRRIAEVAGAQSRRDQPLDGSIGYWLRGVVSHSLGTWREAWIRLMF